MERFLGRLFGSRPDLSVSQPQSEAKPSCLTHCKGACCRAGIRLNLDKKELASMKAAGAVFIERNSRFVDDGTEYELVKDCPHLAPDGKCAVFGKKERPKCCGFGLQIEDSNCLGCRARYPKDKKLPLNGE